MVTLQQVLRLFDFPPQGRVIRLNFRDIVQIGPVDALYHRIEELSLNHNQLTGLDGIQQFRRLKRLSLNFNKISDLKEFEKVPKTLQILEFKSNPGF